MARRANNAAAEAVAVEEKNIPQAERNVTVAGKKINEDEDDDLDDEADEAAWKYRPELIVKVTMKGPSVVPVLDLARAAMMLFGGVQFCRYISQTVYELTMSNETSKPWRASRLMTLW